MPSYPAAKPASEYFDNTGHQAAFEQRRNMQIQHNSLTRPPGQNHWTELDEIKLVDYLWRDWFGENFPGSSWKFDELNLDQLPNRSLRKHELRPFKLQYETYQEIKLRLVNTIIAIKGNPFFVTRIKHDPAKGFTLALGDGEKTWSVKYSDITDLRSIPAMYVSGNATGWLCRLPGRVYQQGLNRHNTVIKSIDGAGNLQSFDANQFLKTFNKRSTRKWDMTLSSLVEMGELPALRLSDDVAVGKVRNKVMVCYRGRTLGVLKDNDIVVNDEDDLLQGWIERSVKEVGLELRA